MSFFDDGNKINWLPFTFIQLFRLAKEQKIIELKVSHEVYFKLINLGDIVREMIKVKKYNY